MVHVKKGNEMSKFKFGDKVNLGVGHNYVITHMGFDGKTYVARGEVDALQVGLTRLLKRGWAKNRRKK